MTQIDLPGVTRSVVKTRYALLTPAGFAPSVLPGWEKAVCAVAVSPAMGAQFSQLLVTLEHDGQCAGNTGTNQYFIYVLEGNASILLDERRHRLEPGSYVYLPAGKDMQLKSAAASARVVIFQKKYEPMPGVARPGALVSHEREVKGQAPAGNEAVRVQVLLPDETAYDLAMSLVTFAPGATMQCVETHVMEHGIAIVCGQGVYRLESDWHLVQRGDSLWISSFCPHWFAAIGKTPATYLCYRDVNREPM
jgi:(S)-ureidoglycine aminohydrolase